MYTAFLSDTSSWLLIVVVLLAAFYIYSTSFVGVFKTVGIPGPTPWPIINHIPELKKHGLSKMLDDWRTKYGKTYGIYGLFPRSATLVTFDICLLEHVMVKDFNNFVDRAGRKTTLSSVTHGLFSLKGSAWRRSRHVISPMFTAGRLKQMLSHVNTSSANFVSLIKSYKEQKKLIPLKTLACRYTSDVIARVGFGMDSKALTEENSEFAYHIDRFIRIPATRLQNIFRTIGEFFPPVMEIGLRLFNKQVDAILPDTENYFVNVVKDVIDRKQIVLKNQVIYESLRMFPPSPDITRRAKETRTYNGVTIPKGTVIFIPIYKIVKDEEYFPDPYKFDPDRFSSQRKAEIDPVSFLPFGFGRRQCVAKRLALMELKVVLCQLLSTMRFVQTEHTVPRKGGDAEYIRVDGFFVAKQPIELDIVLRDRQ